ncbi:MAG: hypothetical protein HY242_12075 [Afipia sp.]|nr:hypothetical protein [Afipia sp.]
MIGLLWNCRIAAPIFLFTVIAASAHAAGALPQLRGKNLNLSWTDNRVEKILSTGVQRPVTQSSIVTVYVSAEGRFFSAFGRTVGHGFVNRKEVSGGDRNALNWRVEGTTLAADQRFMRGARRLIVTFDPGFGSCSLRVLHGKEAGSSTIQYMTMKSLEPVELQSINVTSASCTIGTGNPFS